MAHLCTAPVVDSTLDNGFADSDRVSSAYLHHQESSYMDRWTDVDESCKLDAPLGSTWVSFADLKSPQYQDGLKLFLECLVELDQLDANSPLRLIMEGGGPLFMSQHHLEDPQFILPSARRFTPEPGDAYHSSNKCPVAPPTGRQLNAPTSSRFPYHEPSLTSPNGHNYNEHLSVSLPIAPLSDSTVSKSTPFWSMSEESSHPKSPSFPIDDSLRLDQTDSWNTTAVRDMPGSKAVVLQNQRQQLQLSSTVIWPSHSHYPTSSFSSSREEKENNIIESTTDAHGISSGHQMPVEHVNDSHARGRDGSEELPHSRRNPESKRISRKRSHADAMAEDGHADDLPTAKKSKAMVAGPSSETVAGPKRSVKRPIQVQSALPEMMAQVADGVEIVEASEIENDGIEA
ncbi:hypothetical protein JR316_0009545 [Psilocybe cubensis]|uniref:Uncharacterized protein n=2 Tax=Psilocybe cubensis TaxID=181762 RepID=A0ACB8GNM0_PSICU|nr:hypothetical protein JR316_0009545 [Psilocybe cubensis]KAH9477340.1 hypothetical protein JR316_0009545 [Psilocybe cubensis]